MADVLTKWVKDCETGEEGSVPLTAEEIAAHEQMTANALARDEARQAEDARIEDLKTSARSKLVAGQPLTEEEASVLVI